MASQAGVVNAASHALEPMGSSGLDKYELVLL